MKYILLLFNHVNGIIKAYENYLSDMMKQALLDQLRIQSTFAAIQWRKDILEYFVSYYFLN